MALKTTDDGQVICRLDGRLSGVHGPLIGVPIDPQAIGEILGWNPEGGATLKVWQQVQLGRNVRATCQAGCSDFTPLEEGEDGTSVGAGLAHGCPIYDLDGRVVADVSRQEG